MGMQGVGMKIEVLYVDGRRVEMDISRHNAIRQIHKLIGCDTGDTVNLRDGRVMCVDDTGMVDGKPVNKQATKLYHSIYSTQFSIHGDAAIVVDKYFE